MKRDKKQLIAGMVLVFLGLGTVIPALGHWFGLGPVAWGIVGAFPLAIGIICFLEC